MLLFKNGEIIDIRELTEETVSEYYIEVGQKEQFASFAGEQAKPQNDGFVVTLSKEEVPNFVRKLVEAGIDLYTIQPNTKRLEDQFIEMTGGGAIDAIR